MTAVIDLGSFPQALGQDVQRINPQTGKALQPTLDNEYFLAQWVKDNTQALDDFTVTVQATADDALGLGEQATAFGRMRLNATTAPTGVSARFAVELEVTAGSNTWAETGFYMDVTSGGTSRITFIASQFLFIDPAFNSGLAAVVLEYVSGAWYFNVPVIIRTGEIGSNAASKLRVTTGSGSSVSMVVTDFIAGSELNVIAIASVTAGYANNAVTPYPAGPYLQILLDGSLQAQAFVPITLDTRCTGGTGTVNLTTGAITSFSPVNELWWQAPTMTCPAKFNTSSTSHTIVARWNTATGSMPSGDFYLIVAEHKR